jgi:hypothetical protein
LKKKEETTTSYKNCYKSGLGKILTTLNPEIFHKLLTSLDKRISLLYSSYRANNQSGTIPIGIKKNIQDIIDEDSHREPSKKIIYSPSIIKDYRWIYNQLFVEKSDSQEEGGPKGPPLATPPVLDQGDPQPFEPVRFPESLQPSSWNNDDNDDEEHSLPPSSLGSPVGSPVGSSNGSPLGSPVGSPLGSPVGSPVGSPLGSPVGSPLGSLNGSQLETSLGSPVGSLNGSQVGSLNGSPVGSLNGSPVGSPVGIDPQVRGIGTRKNRNALIGLNLNEEPLTPPTPHLAPLRPLSNFDVKLKSSNLPTPQTSNFERTRKEGLIDHDISSKPRFPRNQTPYPRRPLSIDPNGKNALAIAGKLGRVSDPIISNLPPTAENLISTPIAESSSVAISSNSNRIRGTRGRGVKPGQKKIIEQGVGPSGLGLGGLTKFSGKGGSKKNKIKKNQEKSRKFKIRVKL